MTTAFGIEEMRAAIADLSAGNGDAAEFEVLVARALSDGSLTPEIARTVLHEGMASGVIDAATLERLGLGSVLSNETLIRVSPPAPDRDVHTRVNEGRGQTPGVAP